MNSIEVTGKNVEQAIEIGLFKLEAKREDVKIIVLDEGGLFDKARIKLILKTEYENQSAVEKFVNDFTDSLGLKVFASIEEKENEIKINFAGEDVGLIIGKRGDVLDSIQVLFNQIINKNVAREDYKKIIIDSQNYRTKREQSLKILANRLADKAVKNKRIEKLEPMSSYERKIIHLSLEDRTDVSTVSKNEEPNRYITIIPIKGYEKTNTEPVIEDLNKRANND